MGKQGLIFYFGKSTLCSIVFFLFLLTGCEKQETRKMDDTLKNFQFSCVHEKDHFPPLDPEADIWFKEARRLEIKKGPKDFDHIAFLYRQAVAKGHYKAIGNLQNMIAVGQAEPLAGKTRPEEVIDLTEKLTKMDIPFGYYIMGTYLQRGYGVKQDPDAALQYFLKAAVMGNADGQLAIGELFLNARTPLYRLDLGRAMLKCAAEQGNIDAAYSLAINYEVRDKNYTQALIYYQLAISY